MSKEIESLFIPYEEALKLKELGFNEPCLTYYFDTLFGGIILYPKTQPGSGFSLKGFKNSYKKFNLTDCTAPIYSQAFKWFRDKYGLYSHITTYDATDFEWYIHDKNKPKEEDIEDTTTQYTYEEAELECLKQLIKIVQDEQTNKI